MKSIFSLGLAIAAAGIGLGTTAVTAAENQIEVSYASLDLSKPAGREVLLARVDAAAHQICGPEPLIMNRLRDGARYDACIKKTTARAMASLPRDVAMKFEPSKTIHEASLQ